MWIERKNYLWSWYHLLVDWKCPSGIDVIINDSLIIKFPDLKRGGRPLSCVDNKAVVNIISTTGAAIKADNHRREKSLHNLHQVFCFFLSLWWIKSNGLLLKLPPWLPPVDTSMINIYVLHCEYCNNVTALGKKVSGLCIPPFHTPFLALQNTKSRF